MCCRAALTSARWVGGPAALEWLARLGWQVDGLVLTLFGGCLQTDGESHEQARHPQPHPPIHPPTHPPVHPPVTGQVTLVVNYDIPVERDASTPAYDTYLHRIGRSGRFGRKGAAFNLICGEQVGRLRCFVLGGSKGRGGGGCCGVVWCGVVCCCLLCVLSVVCVAESKGGR